MPSINACVAWATPVDPVRLGAHFEAYINLWPTIQTLRLCNRFGKGEDVPVTRLPIEIIGMIEDNLMEEEREKKRARWAREYRCWKDSCKFVDHFTKAELVEEYNEYVGDCNRAKGHLNSRQLAKVEAFLDDDRVEATHSFRKWCWASNVGLSAEASDSVFQEYKQILLKDFGLEVWTSNIRPSQAKNGQKLDTGTAGSTSTYLVLPGFSNWNRDFDWQYVDMEDEDSISPPVPIESGYGVVLARPTRPTDASVKRFPRAMKLLGLTTTAKTKSLLSASIKDAKDKGLDEEASNVDAEKNLTDASLPRLRLLISCQGLADESW